MSREILEMIDESIAGALQSVAHNATVLLERVDELEDANASLLRKLESVQPALDAATELRNRALCLNPWFDKAIKWVVDAAANPELEAVDSGHLRRDLGWALSVLLRVHGGGEISGEDVARAHIIADRFLIPVKRERHVTLSTEKT